MEFYCDNKQDCPDGTDEAYCATTPTILYSNLTTTIPPSTVDAEDDYYETSTMTTMQQVPSTEQMPSTEQDRLSTVNDRYPPTTEGRRSTMVTAVPTMQEQSSTTTEMSDSRIPTTTDSDLSTIPSTLPTTQYNFTTTQLSTTEGEKYT